MIRRPPRSTPFPTRRSSDLALGVEHHYLFACFVAGLVVKRSVEEDHPHPTCDKTGRSEEHTSELQSLTNLVCRLLLEKKQINMPDVVAQQLTHEALSTAQAL